VVEKKDLRQLGGKDDQSLADDGRDLHPVNGGKDLFPAEVRKDLLPVKRSPQGKKGKGKRN